MEYIIDDRDNEFDFENEPLKSTEEIKKLKEELLNKMV